VVVVMENKEYGSVIGSRSARYENSLAARYALATHFFGVSHPSLPNYIAMVAGSTLGIHSDCTGCNRSAPNLVDQLESAGVTWKAYMESMPRPCFTGGSSGGYAKKHDPFMYFNDVRGNRSRCGKIVPAGQLSTDLRAGALPQFAFIAPNLCDDTHDCSVSTGDRYLSRLVPALLQEIGPHGFLVLTWDEGDSNRGCCGGLAKGGHIPTIVAGPDVRGGAKVAIPYSHYSTLRTIENAFGVAPLGNARRAQPLDAAFTTPPRLR
jgi:phospholipase C